MVEVTISELLPTTSINIVEQVKEIVSSQFGREMVQKQGRAAVGDSDLRQHNFFVSLAADAETPAAPVVGYVAFKLSRSTTNVNNMDAVLHTLVVHPFYRRNRAGDQTVRKVLQFILGNYPTVGFCKLGALFTQEGYQKKLIAFYENIGFVVDSDGDFVSNGTVSQKIPLENLASIASLFSSGSKPEKPEKASSGKTIWMKKRLLSRHPAKVVMTVEHFQNALKYSLITAELSSKDLVVSCANANAKLRHGLVFEQQLGPVCGVAAIWMIMSSIFVEVHAAVDDLLLFATGSKLTHDGSFFDKKKLQELASTHPVTSKYFRTSVQDEFPTVEAMTAILAAKVGDFFLVAYDREGQGVGFKGGRSAHWCVVVGFLVVAGEFYLYCQHSNSPSPFIVAYPLLKKSNNQLTRCEGNKFVVPGESVDLQGVIHLKRK